MTVYGYLRVSTQLQSEENFKSAILEYANNNNLGHVTFISETRSGRVFWQKRLLGQQFEKMKEGDIIITSEFSRIGRDFMNSLQFIAECRKKGVKIISLSGDIPTDNDAISNLVLAVNAFKSHTERDLISFRTKQGLKCAKDRGVKLGRSNKLKLEKDLNNERLIMEELKQGVKIKEICKHYNCCYNTLTKYIKKYDLKKV